MSTINLALNLENKTIPHKKEDTKDFLEKKVWCSSSQKKVYPGSAGLASSALLAYSYHKKLVLRPDDIWLPIIQGASTHIVNNAEAYRNIFVSHEGKNKIIVNLDHVKHHGVGSVKMWGPGVDLICEELDKQVKCEVGKIFGCDFSSSTPTSITSSKITLMKAMEKYFSYKCMTCCGIPQVELLGSLEDWKLLETKRQKLEDLLLTPWSAKELKRWFGNTKNVISNFIATFEGGETPSEDIRTWWSHIFDIKEVYGSGGGTYYSGWIRDLYLYQDGEKYFMPSNDRKITWDDFPKGYCEVEFVFDDDGTEYGLQLVAGHVGTWEREDGALVPEIAWFVTQNKEDVGVLNTPTLTTKDDAVKEFMEFMSLISK